MQLFLQKSFHNFFKKISIVGFDFDGTILNNRRIIKNRFKDNFKNIKNYDKWIIENEFNLLKINSQNYKRVNKLLRIAFAIIHPINRIKSNFKFYRLYSKINWECKYRNINIEEHKIEEISELIEICNNNNKIIFIASNQTKANISIFNKFFKQKNFNFVITSDIIGFNKPNINYVKYLKNCLFHEEFIYFGDSWEDLVMCHYSEIPFVLVEYGFWETKSLIKLKKYLVRKTRINSPFWLLSDIIKS